MKALYLLFGLLLLITISSAPPTPFLISGWVFNSDGAPVNDPNVTITNLNTSEVFTAETTANSNYYQHVLENISAGNVLEFNTTNETQSNITKHYVVAEDIGNGTIYPFNITLAEADLTPTPRITGYDPDSHVHDIRNATRTFNITIDQVVNVTWLINGLQAQTNGSVTDASYTNTSADIGVWNISARVSNGNGTAMRNWVWNVTTLPPPNITSFAPTSPVNVTRNATTTFNITVDQVVDVTWLINGLQAQTNGSVTNASYTNTSADIGVWNVSAIVSNGNGTARKEWVWNVSTLLPPKITSFTPPSPPVLNTVNATRTFGIRVDQVVNVTWLINGLQAQTNRSVTDASYTNTSAAIGVWNVTAVANNQNGTDMQEWIWNVTLHAPTLSPVFVIYGNVSYDNGSACNSPFVVITNLNTSGELIADTGEAFYQLVTNSTFVNAGDELEINAHKNGMPVGNATHTVNEVDIGNGVIKEEINERYLPDFTLTNLTFDLPDPWIGDIVKINATIANYGKAEEVVFVEFCDNKSITIERILKDYPDSPNNDTITLLDVKRIRVHFESFNVSSEDNIGNITIYNETQPVEGLNGTGTDHWTEWYDGGTIRINSWNAGFTVDRYEAVLADGHIPLGAGNSTNIPVEWNLSDQFMGWAVHGSHNITVRADPYNEIVESNETNNEIIMVIDVNPSLDFAITNMSLNTTEPVLGDVVGITANISNYGVRNGTTVVGVYYDNRSAEIKRTLSGAGSNSTDIISLPPGVLGARLHLERVKIRDGEITIYDESGRIVERITYSGTGSDIVRNNEWTDWIYSKNITIRIELLPQQHDLLPLGILETNLTWEDDLNNGTVPEDLKDQLYKKLGEWYTLSDSAIVEKEDEDEWIIIDEGIKKCYISKNTESGKLEVDWYYYYGMYNGEFKIDRYEALIAEETVTLNATESKIINASWLTGAAYGGAREHDITVMVDPCNHSVEINEANNTLSMEIFVNGTDLTVTGINIPCGLSEDNYCYVGKAVNVTATIANIGAADATDFTIEFLDNNNNFSKVHIKRLNSSESRTVPVVWNPEKTGDHTITASIPYDNTDNNETNNELSDFPRVKEGYDFLVESVSVEPSKDVRRGESVNITATVCNRNISQTGEKVSVAFFVNSTDFAGTSGERFTRIGTDDLFLGVGETKNVSVNWNVDVADGCHLIVAVVNPDNDIDEGSNCTIYFPNTFTIIFRGSDTGNNVKNCTLHVKPLDLDITDIMLDPAEPNIGDLVDVSINITNNMNMVANSTVWFYMEKDVDDGKGYDGIAAGGSWSWSVLQPGDVQIRVHFKYIEIGRSGEVNAYVIDGQGQDSVHFYVKCREYGGQNAKTPKIEYDTYCFCENGPNRRWNDVWTDWTNGTEIEIRTEASGGNVDLLIDKYQVRLGNETVTLYPNDSMVYNSTWNASLPLKPGENYTLMVNVEDVVMNKTIYLGGTDLAITNLSVKSPVWDGEAVWVNATIENLGSKNATDFSVNFTEVYNSIGSSDTITDEKGFYIKGLDAGNSINIPIPWNVTIRKIEGELADNYTISVEIHPLGNSEKEVDNANHIKEACVHIDESRDFNVTNLSFFVNGTACGPLELDFFNDVVLNATVSITNLINRSGSVDVSFYFDEIEEEHEIGSCSITFYPGNGTEYAQIEWNDMCSPGKHNIIVVADPDEEIYEIDETNNKLTQEIFLNTPELVLESLDILPSNPKRGETMKINVTIVNKGERNASNVNLTIYDWAKRHIENDSNQSGPGRKIIKIPNETKENVTAMRLYLDINVDVEDGGRVCINDSSGSEIICYHENFHGWTPWILDNSTTIIVTNNETYGTYAKVSKVYYLMPDSIINTSIHSLGINETKNITVNWNTSVVGERLIAAIVDPEDCVTEYNESNNRLAEFISVQTADIEVSNLSLLWLNGTKIDNDTIIHGDSVNITVDITNIGVDDAGNFNVRFLIDDILIKEEPIEGLAEGATISLFRDWNATVGYNLIKVEADFKNEINETNETNNIAALYPYICGAELSGNISWVTLGLNDVLLFPENPTQPYDEDEVNITVDIRNSGCAPATNFNAALLFDYTPDYFSKIYKHIEPGGKWINKTYPDAEYIYLKVNTPVYIPGDRGRCMIKDDVIVYDVNDSEVSRPGKSCWVRVKGNTTNILITTEGYSFHPVFDIYFYPIYQNETSMLYKDINVSVNSSHNLFSMNQNVSVGDFTIMVMVDPDYVVPEDEDHREDNIIYKTMHVKPTRDFTVTNVIAAYTNLSDLDITNITTGVSNIGLRNGSAQVNVVDYEEESRTYKYHFNRNLDQSYLPIAPNTMLSGIQFEASPLGGNLQYYEELTIIHRPGVDAIKLHFDKITLKAPSYSVPKGRIEICNETGARKWGLQRTSKGPEDTSSDIYNNQDVLVPGETAYICTYNAFFKLGGYTTETELHREDITLNANRTWNESKNITATWTAYTGDHTISVRLDKDDRISEISESNNELGLLFNVNASRDPAIVELNITPEHPKDGNDVYITAIVTNNGYKDANFTIDVWANLTRNKPRPDESLPDPDLTTDLGEDKIRHITLLKHNVTLLAPGENMTVNATWNDISIAGSPIHHIIAIVDPMDEIDEINESNNEIVKEIIMDYPDLTLGTVRVPWGAVKPVVPVKELGGTCEAPKVTVRFDMYETEEYNKMNGCGRIWHKNASNMQVYFNHIDIYAPNAFVEVRDVDTRYPKPPVARYNKGVTDMWSPWVKGEWIYIDCSGRVSVRIKEYRWGNVLDDQTDELDAGGHEDVELPWTDYREPYYLTITVDPDNNITELNEDNNIKTVLRYADLSPYHIHFFSPSEDKLCLEDVEKFVIDGYITNGGGAWNDKGLSASDFNVTLEFRNRYPNGTVGDAVFNVTEYVEDPLYANEDRVIRFEFDQKEKLEVGDYTVRLIVDSSSDICESNELYKKGEDNNAISVDISVNPYSGYTGGGSLVNYEQDMVHGGVVFTIGDSKRLGSGISESMLTVNFDDVILDGAEVKLARLYLYVDTGSEPGNMKIARPIEAAMEFNGHEIQTDRTYTDISVGTDWNVTYGLYCYDITNIDIENENVAVATRISPYDGNYWFGIAAIGLLVVYEDEDEPLTKYWINEGIDVVMAKNMGYQTGLPFEDCIVSAEFDDVESEDLDGVNATLMAILSLFSAKGLYPEANGEGDVLRFNEHQIGSLKYGSHWAYQCPNEGSDTIAMTDNKWEHVTDYLKCGRNSNLATIQSKGNYIVPSNAFLVLRYPPDLAVTDIDAPVSAVVGNKYTINTTISNEGRSNATDFNVSFYSNNVRIGRQKISRLDSGDNITLQFNWKPMHMGKIYKIKVAADVVSGQDWIEPDTDNNEMTKNVPIVGSGYGSESGPVGGGGSGTGGSGDGEGASLFDTITGILMKGTILKDGEGGGGGLGEFSLLEWLMKGLILATCSLLIYFGFLMEKRRHNKR
jgi:subtilase family serine protease